MKRKLFSLLVTILVFSAAVLGRNQPTPAALCGKCKDLMFIESEGKCSDCGGPTTSGALQICPKCSARRHQCEHCLAATTAKDETATESKPADPVPDQPHRDDAQDKPAPGWTAPANNANPVKPNETAAAKPADPDSNPLRPIPAETGKLTPPENLPESKPPAELPPDPAAQPAHKPINPDRAGTYTAGKWHYQMQITGPGTRNEGRWGWLTYDGQKLPRGEVNDYYNTPWGPLYWVDVPTTAWGVHGWMPVPLAQNRRQGRSLSLPVSMPAGPGSVAARAVAPPASSAGTAPTKPRVQTLEINKSHNGQLARVRVGNMLVIRLPGNPATGYQWQAASTSSPAVRLTVRPQYSPPVSTAAGAAALGTYTFIFQSVQPGTGSIRLYYVRPSDPGRPRDSFAVGVNVSPATAAARPVANSRQPGE
ncbi:MAG: protease inhibitor I42 family protein [Thermoguttaceae bacterium]|jgi:inhibitor of cysteine peptidase